MPQSPSRSRSTRNLLTIALASAAALSFAPAAADAEGWLPGPSFAIPSGNLMVRFAASADGSSTAAWVDTAAGSVGVQHASGDGVLGPVHTIRGGQTATPKLEVAASPSGATAVAWLGPQDLDGIADLRVTVVGADGQPGPVRNVGALLVDPFVGGLRSLQLGVDGDGDVTIAWATDNATHIDRIDADGGHPLDLTLSTRDTPTEVTVGPDGVAWVALTTQSGALRILRVAADGAADEADIEQIAAGNVESVRMVASSAGAVAVWEEHFGGNMFDIRGMRLGATGELQRTPLHTEPDAGLAIPGLDSFPSIPGFEFDLDVPAVAIGPDGTVTLAWITSGPPDNPSSPFPLAPSFVKFARYPADAETATPRELAAGALGTFMAAPALSATADGHVLATWGQVDAASGGAALAFGMTGSRIAPDGTHGAVLPAGISADMFVFATRADAIVQQADVTGSSLLGVLGLREGGSDWVLSTRHFDAAGPVLTLNVPATVTAGTAATYAATAGDRAGVAALAWDFGDGTTSSEASTSHTFTDPGTHTVTFTATDALGNTAVGTRAVTVVSRDVGPGPERAGEVGPGRGEEPGLVPHPRTAAGLKLAGATRSGARVTVRGTISRLASGRVTLVYRQKVGRRTLTARATAKIARGRWSTTFKLRGKLASAGGKATVTASYRGDADTRSAAAQRAVSKPKPAKKKRKAAPGTRRG